MGDNTDSLSNDELAGLLAGGRHSDIGVELAEFYPDAGLDEAEAGDAAFLRQLLRELEGDPVADPLDGLDHVALPGDAVESDEEYWQPVGDADAGEDEQAEAADRHQAAGRGAQAGRARSQKRKWSQARLETLVRSGRVPHQRIKSAVNRVRVKLDIAQQRSKRVQDSFLLHPNEQARALEAGSGIHDPEANKPEVVRRTRSNLEQVEHLRNRASAVKSEWGQAHDRLGMLTQAKSQDKERVNQQRQAVLQLAAALMSANSEFLTAQVRYQRRKLPAGAFYMFKEGGKEQVCVARHHVPHAPRASALHTGHV